MPRTSATTFVNASPDVVAELYRDWHTWPATFGETIHGVHLIETRGKQKWLAIDHRAGRVINRMTEVSPDRVDLWEEKPRYIATFQNRFEPAPGGTRIRVDADVRLKGPLMLLGPLVSPFIRRHLLEPLRRAAEGEPLRS